MVGAGPAGRAVAAACVDTGLTVTLVAPSPRRVWPHTYAAWLDELPASLPRSTVASVMPRMRAFGTSRHELDREYAVLDNTALWKHLWRSGITEVTGKVVGTEHGPTGSTVRLKDGRGLATAAVVDASGASRVLSGGRPSRVPAAQTAVGVIVDTADAQQLCPDGTGMFMDWRPPPETRGGWPTFLYAVRLDEHRVLLEETSLARRPGLPLAQLRRRLQARLESCGITPHEQAPEERVRFPVDDPLPRQSRVVPFGASGGLVHPATGFSVAASLRQAPWIAGALGTGLAWDPASAAKAAWSVLWPPRALTADGLRRRALQGLLSLPPERVPEFFEVFFSLDQHHQTAFLTADERAGATMRAMTALFRTAPWELRRRLVTGGISPRRSQARHGLGGL